MSAQRKTPGVYITGSSTENYEQEPLKSLAVRTRAKELISPYFYIDHWPELIDILEEVSLKPDQVVTVAEAYLMIAIVKAFHLGGRTDQMIPIGY